MSRKIPGRTISNLMSELENFDFDQPPSPPSTQSQARRPIAYERSDSANQVNSPIRDKTVQPSTSRRAIALPNVKPRSGDASPIISTRSGSLPKSRTNSNSSSTTSSTDNTTSKTYVNPSARSVTSTTSGRRRDNEESTLDIGIGLHPTSLNATLSLGLVASSISIKRDQRKIEDPDYFNPKKSTSSSSIADDTDEMILSMMLQESLFDTASFKLLSQSTLQSRKKEYKGLAASVSSLHNKLGLEWRINEATAKIDDPNKLKQSNAKIERIAADLIKTTAELIQVERSLLRHYSAVLNWEIVRKQREERTAARSAFSPGTNDDAAEIQVKEQKTLISVLNKKIASLEEKQRTLEREVSDSKDQVVAAKAERDAFEKSNQKLEKEFQKTSTKFPYSTRTSSSANQTPTSAEYNRLKLDLATTRADLASVKENFDAARDSVAHLQLQVEEEITLLESKDREIATLKCELEESKYKNEMHTASEEAASKLTNATPQDKLIASLKTKIEILEKRVVSNNTINDVERPARVRNVLGTQLKDAVIERERLKMELLLESDRAKNVENQLETLKGTLPRGRKKQEQAASDDDDTDTEDEAGGFTRTEYSPTTPTLRKPASLKRSTSPQVIRSRGDSNKLGTRPRSPTIDTTKLTQEISDLEIQVQEYRDSQTKLVSLQKELGSSSRLFDVNQFIEFVRQVIDERDSLRSKIRTLSEVSNTQPNNDSEVSNLERKLASVTTLLDESSREIVIFERKQDQHARDLLESTQKYQDCKSDYDELRGRYKKLELNYAESQDHYTSLLDIKEGLEHDLDDLQARYERVRDEKEENEQLFKNQIVECETRARVELERTKQNLKTDMNNLRMERMENEKKREFDQVQAENREELKRIKAEHKKEIDTIAELHKSELDKLNFKLKRTETMLTEIRSEKDRYTQICTELEQELSTIESESKEYKTKLEHKTRELNSLQNQNSRLEQEADRLQKKLESFKSNDRELISLKSVEKGLRQDLEYVENKLKTVQQELQAAKDAEGVMLEEIQKVQLASVSMRSRSEDLEEELEILKRKAGNDRALVEKMQPEVERLTKELTETTNELANLKTTTKNDLSSYYNQIQTLKSDTAKLQTRVQQQALEGLSKVQIAIFSGSDNQRMKDEFQKMVNDLKVHYEEQIETEIKWRKASDKEVAAIRGIDVVEAKPEKESKGKYFGFF